MDLIGKTVRWEGNGWAARMWFTARVLQSNGFGGFVGEVVQPGDFRDAQGVRLTPWRTVRNLRRVLCTVIDSEPDTQDPECE